MTHVKLTLASLVWYSKWLHANEFPYKNPANNP